MTGPASHSHDAEVAAQARVLLDRATTAAMSMEASQRQTIARTRADARSLTDLDELVMMGEGWNVA